MDSVANHLQVFEILASAQRSRSDEKRIAVLKEHDCLGLRDILKAIYDERLKAAVPSGETPFTPNAQESAPTTLRKESARLAYFFAGVPGLPKGTNVGRLKREQMYIQFLEALPPAEADLVLGAIAKKMPQDYEKITEEIVRQAFPTILHPKKVDA